MSNIVRFTVQGFPRTKGSTKSFMHPHTGRIITMNDNKKEKPWSSTVSLMAQCAAPRSCPWSGAIELNLTFYLPKPKYLAKKKQVYHTKKPDLDKLERSVTDALTGVFFCDDSQVVQGVRSKEYGDRPGVVVEVVNLEVEDGERKNEKGKSTEKRKNKKHKDTGIRK